MEEGEGAVTHFERLMEGVNLNHGALRDNEVCIAPTCKIRLQTVIDTRGLGHSTRDGIATVRLHS